MNDVDGRPRPPSRFATVLALSLGNAIEIYDFTVYSFFSLTIGKLFFPVQSEFGPLLLALLTFGIGFVVRPLGGIVIGAYADRAGRRPALVLTIALMALGTLLIGLCPTYADIGLLAPAAIVVGRCLQGFSAGGEIGVATTFLMELGRPSGRGLRVSWQMASQGAAALCGALSGYILTTTLPPGALEAGVWRIPFLVGLLIIPVGLYARWSLPETAVGGRRQTVILRNLVSGHGRTLFAGVLMIMGGTASTYVNIYYMPTYLIKTIALPPQSAFLAGCFAGATLLIVAPLAGRLSDRLGSRRPFVFWSWLGTAVLTYPAFWVVVQTQSATAALVAFVVLIGFNAAGSGSCLIMVMENFPRGVRATGLSVVYSVGVSVFGGFAPFIVTWLISVSGNPMSPAWYVTACATAALFGVTRLRERTEPEGAVPVQR
ncbi:MFS transporter [Azospirillum canadense]|uniref:MFS transporter n=1 Tax=Azospirillum canadense TaxID=403962 RepID=UPI0022266EAF|nr:MFS transporter [Azospirillum canadense]MCW2236413.1 MHS family proline/betaine transporter-like MFS transporter [Azospirillum canadense]